jgi:hypothetical protein
LAECRRKKPVDDRLFFVGLILDAKKIARKNKKKIGPIYDSVTPGLDFGVHQAQRYLCIAYIQPLARLHTAIARLDRFLGYHIINMIYLWNVWFRYDS